MPGIVGLVTKKPRAWAEPRLMKMLAAIRHESFYSHGSWIDESMGAYAAWTSRAGSFSDGMPIRNEAGDITLIFSGEEFPESSTISYLRECGHSFAAAGASYIVHLYEESREFPACLNGRFHGIIADRRNEALTIFTDRYGMHPLYYYEDGEDLYFAAEVKAILATCVEARELDFQALAELVSCGCIMEGRTLFRRVRLMPPASSWICAEGSVRKKGYYFEPREWEDQALLDAESYYKEIRDLFSRNLTRYFNHHGQIGMSLTGGLDTRMIMAWQQCAPGALPCYTFGGTYRDCRDVLIARKVASVCNQPHEVINVGEEFLSKFPHYAERTVYLTDGFADVSRSPALYANEKARDIGPVRMAGVYGSEILRRLPSFKPTPPIPSVFCRDIYTEFKSVTETYARVAQLHPVSQVVFQQTPQRAVDALEETQVEVRHPFFDNEIVRAAFRAPGSENLKEQNEELCFRLIAEGNPLLAKIPTDRGLGGRTQKISHALQQFTFKSEYAYDYGMPQFVAEVDHALAPFRLERLFLGRHKFAHFRVWYRDVLRGYVQEMLLDSRTLSRSYLERKGVEAVVRGHLKGNRNYTTAIHRLLSLELLHRLFLDAN